MPHETSLIATIVMGLVLAFAGGFIASKLKLPPLVGYLLAGVAVGPFTPGFVADEELALQLAEIGVILLMFGVGLHFSIKDLMAVRRIAIPGAAGQMAVATALGAGIAVLWGWPLGAGLVFGLALSVASTVVLLRALEERGVLDGPDGSIAVGWLIVEDLAMVLALVLLPALAGALGGNGGETAASGGGIALTLALTLGKVALFLVLVLTVGARIIPWLLTQVAKTGSRELFTLSVLATALGIAFGSAVLFGVSFALGAFFAGVVLSETDFSHRAAAESLPLQDAFAVLFFVSVGMLFDPSILVTDPLAVLAVVFVIVVGKSLAAFAIVIAFGYPVSTALTVSASLAQIGEFSFILAGLGMMLGLLPQDGQDLILAGALLSITLNPLVFKLCDRIGAWIETHPDARGPRTLKRLHRQDEPLSAATGGDALSDHAVIVGYGRVGSVVGNALREQDLGVRIIEKDIRRVRALRGQGLDVVYGDAATPGVMDAAGVAAARLIVIATPDGYQTRQLIERARGLNPTIDTAVRTHSESEIAHLERQGVGVAIMGERELAFGLVRHALRSLGVSDAKARMLVQSLRVSGDGGAYERRPDDPKGAPELRGPREETPEAG